MKIPRANTIKRVLARTMTEGLLGRRSGFSADVSRLLFKAYQNGFHGAFADVDTMPGWARSAARESFAGFRDEARHPYVAEDVLSGKIVGSGKGKRAVNFQFAMKLDPMILYGSQDFGNCTSWMMKEMTGCQLALDIALGQLHEYTTRPGTAVVYGSRGHNGQGMSLSRAINTVHNKGIQLMSQYCDGRYDLREERADESYGNAWGRSGPPSCILEEIDGNYIEHVVRVTAEQACLDLLFGGYFLGHGSQLTARPNGRLISGLTSIGGHAQAWIGYDDTDEFREWYKKNTGKTLNDWVAINDQSWGNWNPMPDEVWPTHLWGPRPQGAWVVTGRDQMKIVRQWGDCWAISNVVGFPLREIPDWGSHEYL